MGDSIDFHSPAVHMNVRLRLGGGELDPPPPFPLHGFLTRIEPLGQRRVTASPEK